MTLGELQTVLTDDELAAFGIAIESDGETESLFWDSEGETRDFRVLESVA